MKKFILETVMAAGVAFVSLMLSHAWSGHDWILGWMGGIIAASIGKHMQEKKS